MEFLKTEIGKILYHGIHENNTSISQIRSITYLIRGVIESGGSLTNDELKQYLNMLDSAAQKSQDGMDYVYSKIKEIKEV